MQGGCHKKLVTEFSSDSGLTTKASFFGHKCHIRVCSSIRKKGFVWDDLLTPKGLVKCHGRNKAAPCVMHDHLSLLHTHTQTHMHTHMHTDMHTHMHTHKRKHTHAHARAPTLILTSFLLTTHARYFPRVNIFTSTHNRKSGYMLSILRMMNNKEHRTPMY